MIESFFNNSYQEKKELKFWAEKQQAVRYIEEQLANSEKQNLFIL